MDKVTLLFHEQTAQEVFWNNTVTWLKSVISPATPITAAAWFPYKLRVGIWIVRFREDPFYRKDDLDPFYLG